MFLSDIVDVLRLKGQQKRTIESNKEKYNMLCDTSDVFEGYTYFKAFLFEKLIKIFKYDGLPETMPQDAIEDYILKLGKTGVTDSRYGLVGVPVNKSGVGLYPRYEPVANWCTPLVEGSGIIGKDIVVIKNNSYELSCVDIVNRYARMLADVESTFSNVAYNLRIPSLSAFPNEESAESYKAVMVANRLGQTDAVLDKSIIGEMKSYPNITGYNGDILGQLVTARQDILRMFFAEIGVNTQNEKRERMTEDEVLSNNQMLLFNIRDMLDCRKKGVEEINRLYGTNITVELNEEYKLIQKGGVNNGDKENIGHIDN